MIPARVCVIAALLLAGVPLAPAAASDYAWEWPIVTSAAAPAYRVELTGEVYARLQDPLLRDVEVFDADEQRMPSAWSGVTAEQRRSIETRDVAWFPLPERAPQQGSELRAWISRGPGNAQVNVELNSTEVAADAGSDIVRSLLVDLGDGQRALVALELRPLGEQPWQVRLALEVSDDLDHWTPLRSEADLYRLQHQGRQLSRLRIELPGQRSRYLRLLVRGDSPLPPLAAVQASFASHITAELPARTSLELDAQASAVAGEWIYQLPGPYPVETLAVDFADAAWVAEAQLSSRMDADRDWHSRASQVVYRMQSGGQTLQSEPVAIGVNRDRQWRLRLSPAPASAPRLRASYRADGVAFIAAGREPYKLVAGSARSRRIDAPLGSLIASLRADHGASWQPVAAALGAAHAREVAAVEQFGQWGGRALLWLTLCAGALGVLWMIRRLLIQPSQV